METANDSRRVGYGIHLELLGYFMRWSLLAWFPEAEGAARRFEREPSA